MSKSTFWQIYGDWYVFSLYLLIQDGHVKCQRLQCRPLSCKYKIYDEDNCCPRCAVNRAEVSISNRYRQRFFDQVGHQTMFAYVGNKHFFTKSCHRQTYQNYEQPPHRLQNSYFQSLFFCKVYLTRRSTFTNEIFWKLWFLKFTLFSKNVPNFCRLCS